MGVTWACMLAMSLLQDQGMGELLAQLESEEPKKRQEAVELIVGGWAKWKEEDLKKLAQAQEGSDVEVKTRVREAVKRMDICRKVGAKVLEKVPRLDRMLYEIDPKECVAVLMKVWEACPGEDLGGMVEVVKGMPWSVEEKMGMLDAIKVKQMRSYAGLAAAWLKESDAYMRSVAASALAAVGAKEQVGAIAALLKESDAYVRGDAASALARLGAKEQVGVIAALLKDSDKYVRVAAIYALATLGAKKQAGSIAALLKDSDAFVRSSAAFALAALGAKEHLQAIGELLKDGDRNDKVAAIIAIGRLGPPTLESQADELGRKLDAFQKDQSDEYVRFVAAVARIGWERATVQEESNRLQECEQECKKKHCKGGLPTVELIDALTRRYEKEGYKAMAAQREVKEDLKSWEDVKRWAKEGGMELEGSSTLRGTIWKGSERSMLQVISSELSGELWEIEGKKVRVLGWEEALKYWQERLKR